MVVSALISFAASLLVGAAAIYIAAAVLVDVRDYEHAIITALVGALAWFVSSLFLGWIPFVGPLLVLIAYLWIINARYPGGWIKAALIALGAWVVGVVLMTLLATVGVVDDLLGIPGI